MKAIMDFINEKALRRNDMMFFSKKDALSLIELCENHNVPLLGIDGFYFFGDRIQPSMENSVDFSSVNYMRKEKNIFIEAKEFLILKNSDLYFEIVLPLNN